MSKNNIHHFDRDIAVEYGLEAAVIIYNFRFWLDKNKALNKNNRDGFIWTYNTVEAMQSLFPYLTTASIRRVLKKLEDEGFLISAKLSSNGHNRTKWYTIPSEYNVDNFSQIEEKSSETLDTTHLSIPTNAIVDSSKSICRNQQMSQIINTDSKPYKKDSALQPGQKTVKTQHQQGANIKVHVPERNLEKNKLSPEAAKELKAQMMSGLPN